MTFDNEFHSLHLWYEPDPPLLDRRRPLAMAYRQAEDESFLAVAALEITHFSVCPPDHTTRPSTPPPYELGWARTVDALLHLKLRGKTKRYLRGVRSRQSKTNRLGSSFGNDR